MKETVEPIPVIDVVTSVALVAVSVHPPVEGKLEMATDPVAKRQVGWVTPPAMGVLGTLGTEFIITDEVGLEVQAGEVTL